MQINNTDANDTSGFYTVNFETFTQTLEESTIEESYEMGGGVAIYYGTRNGSPVWLMDNPLGKLYGVWVEENGQHPH
ncbi:hypothetical protein [Methylotenera versatilis]|uniref:hypothetical protein n=1 Tax=Methylotenera versatilis TaxID=1055487 RepID=UPI00059EB025|nr:hypothetical protein [Methylotenera versatilis]